MGMVSIEALAPLVWALRTFRGFVLILPHRCGSLMVPGGCVRRFRGGFGGAASIEFSIPCESGNSLLTASSNLSPFSFPLGSLGFLNEVGFLTYCSFWC
ncbi:hypothetical protein EDD15DRAFT_428950 [Pisolithus albus]|nr:hypothetical protein EDD15DRAFT_428950 [Pisolithus albus]